MKLTTISCAGCAKHALRFEGLNYAFFILIGDAFAMQAAVLFEMSAALI
jgi:hypothetical protein